MVVSRGGKKNQQARQSAWKPAAAFFFGVGIVFLFFNYAVRGKKDNALRQRTRVPSQIAMAEAGIGIAAPPVVHDPSSQGAASPAVPLQEAKYVFGEAGSTACPATSVPLEESEECEIAAAKLGRKFQNDDPKTDLDPPGCTFRVPDEDMYFNSPPKGGENKDRKVICRIGPPPGPQIETASEVGPPPAAVAMPAAPAAPVVRPAGSGNYVMGEADTNDCPSGSEPLTEPEECEAAAAKLGRPFISDDPRSDTDPKGCQFRPPDQDVLFNSHETGSPHSGRLPICREGAAGPSLPQAAPPAPALQGPPVQPEPVPLAASAAGSAVPAGKKEYIMGETDTNDCPAGSKALESSEECEAAAEALGKKFMTDDPRAETDPKGCQFRPPDQDIYFNGHETGSPHSARQPVCVQGTTS